MLTIIRSSNFLCRTSHKRNIINQSQVPARTKLMIVKKNVYFEYFKESIQKCKPYIIPYASPEMVENKIKLLSYKNFVGTQNIQPNDQYIMDVAENHKYNLADDNFYTACAFFVFQLGSGFEYFLIYESSNIPIYLSTFWGLSSFSMIHFFIRNCRETILTNNFIKKIINKHIEICEKNHQQPH